MSTASPEFKASRPADAVLRADIRSVLEVLSDFTGDENGKGRVNLDQFMAPDLRCFDLRVKAVELQIPRLPPIQFRPGGKIRHGGGGVIFECWREGFKNRAWGLKVPRPSNLSPASEGRPIIPANSGSATLTPKQLRDWIDERIHALERVGSEADQSNREAVNAADLNNFHVVRLDGLSSITLQVPLEGRLIGLQQTIGLYEWIDKSDSFEDYALKKVKNWKTLIDLLRQILDGLGHIHQHGLIHWDIKSDNCLVTVEGTGGEIPLVKIIDVGNARTKLKKSSRYTEDQVVYTSISNAPLEILPPGELTRHRTLIVLKRGTHSLDCPKLDLFYFGRMFGRLLGFYTDPGTSTQIRRARAKFVSTLGRRAKAFGDLRIIYNRLVDWSGDSYQETEQVLSDINAIDVHQILPRASSSIRDDAEIRNRMLASVEPYLRDFARNYGLVAAGPVLELCAHPDLERGCGWTLDQVVYLRSTRRAFKAPSKQESAYESFVRSNLHGRERLATDLRKIMLTAPPTTARKFEEEFPIEWSTGLYSLMRFNQVMYGETVGYSNPPESVRRFQLKSLVDRRANLLRFASEAVDGELSFPASVAIHCFVVTTDGSLVVCQRGSKGIAYFPYQWSPTIDENILYKKDYLEPSDKRFIGNCIVRGLQEELMSPGTPESSFVDRRQTRLLSFMMEANLPGVGICAYVPLLLSANEIPEETYRRTDKQETKRLRCVPIEDLTWLRMCRTDPDIGFPKGWTWSARYLLMTLKRFRGEGLEGVFPSDLESERGGSSCSGIR